MTSDTTLDTKLKLLFVEALFRQLSGTWVLDRRLQSTNASEPSGNCFGSATFTPREPSVFVNIDGKLELASAEMVYHEQGHFQMHQTTLQADALRFPFSRKYVWRLQEQTDVEPPTISIWFTKPGTEVIDYLFHKVNVTINGSGNDVASSGYRLECDGGHLCEDDFYSSTYTFDIHTDGIMTEQSVGSLKLQGWTMLHEVRGPQKDQVIETRFKRD